jgi:mono/diheme cytochrome c family protein
VAPGAARAADAEQLARGKYLFDAAGCQSCHTDVAGKGVVLAGGRRLKTPFGDFYTPNITADPAHGIGKWSDADFIRALRQGQGPDGTVYYPAFPYPSYTGMTDRDILDIKAYIFSLPTSAAESRGHDLKFPFGMRWLNHAWQALFLKQGPWHPTPGKDETYNRGSYLVEAVAHCGECHSPRNFVGAVRYEARLSGSPNGADNDSVPNVTPHDDGIGDLSVEEIASMLKDGMTPDGDFLGGAMEEEVSNSTSKLTDADRMAIATYLKAQPALPTTKK